MQNFVITLSSLSRWPVLFGILLVLFSILKVTVLIQLVGISSSGIFFLSYGALAVAALLVILNSIEIYSMWSILFILTTLISSLLSTYVEQSLMKWFGWSLLFVVFGPFSLSIQSAVVKEVAWELFMFLSLVISIASFFWYLAGFPNLGRGVYTGIMTHSMLLAPLAGIATVYSVNSLFQRNAAFWGAVAVISAWVCLLAGSRVSLIALVAAVSLCLFLNVKERRNLHMPAVVAVVALVWIAIFNLDVYLEDTSQSDATSYLRDKGSQNTRKGLWTARLDEFSKNPVIGVGVGVGSASELTDWSGVVVSSEGDINIEPGSSYLAVLSMTGTFGAITLFAILISILKENLRVFNQDTPQSSNAELVSILAYLFVHGLAEGWIFAVGNPFCLLFWLALGRASNLQFGVSRNIILHESYDIRS